MLSNFEKYPTSSNSKKPENFLSMTKYMNNNNKKTNPSESMWISLFHLILNEPENNKKEGFSYILDKYFIKKIESMYKDFK